MTDIQRLLIEENGETYEIYIESKDEPAMPTPSRYDRPGMGIREDTATKMQSAHRLIRGYTAYVLSAFRDFSAAQVEEVTLTFGIKIGGKTGIPYITEGSAESNLQIQVKCKFPP
ncbi:CU044_2847 family protein [Trichothermofontia sichuanensis B231]|uniref:CU044_2847 family protein n=1 Tax=Trichothermofontia sichuanensis TaxID=3045816 RepID=UPI002245CAE0|nr:CU044_2847 family protein [Trichothermofontia sichuanensis]UZQ56238.1 CU044_2847 family protein [Trichothermofontia sichuanensis B231]